MKTLYIKAPTFLLGLVPLAYIGWQAWLAIQGETNTLGPDPGKAIEHFNGDWALRFLLITLAVTPIRQITGWSDVARVRRMLGLFTFFYATLHFASYLFFILGLHFDQLAHDIVKHPYILVGFTAWCLLVPLAATSNQWMVRRLKQRWKKLHRVIYVIALLALVHLFWLTRSSYFDVAMYGGIVALLLGFRAKLLR